MNIFMYVARKRVKVLAREIVGEQLRYLTNINKCIAGTMLKSE